MWSKQIIFALLVRPKTRYLIEKNPKLTQIGSSLFIATYDLLLSLLDIIRKYSNNLKNCLMNH